METPRFAYLSPIGSLPVDEVGKRKSYCDDDNFSPLMLSLSSTPVSLSEDTTGDSGSSIATTSMIDLSVNELQAPSSNSLTEENVNRCAFLVSTVSNDPTEEKKRKRSESISNSLQEDEKRAPFQSPLLIAQVRTTTNPSTSSYENQGSQNLSEKPDGRISPIIDQLEGKKNKCYPQQMLLLDYEEVQRQKTLSPDVLVKYVGGSFESLIAKEINHFYEKSPVCQAMTEYGKETKYVNESLVTNMMKIHEQCKRANKPTFFPPTSNNYGHLNTDAVYLVSVPTTFLEAPEENPAHSFCDVEIKTVCNTDENELYTRIVHTVGIDIRQKDGVIYKHPLAPIPRSIHITKCHEKMRKGVKFSRLEFMSRYELQSGNIDTTIPVLASVTPPVSAKETQTESSV